MIEGDDDSEALLSPRLLKDDLDSEFDSPRGLPASPVQFHEYWRLAIIMGSCDILIDVDKYFLYFLLIRTVGCDFQASYGMLYLVYTVTYLLWSPIAGSLSDLLQEHILYIMLAVAVALIVIYSLFMAVTLSPVQLAAMYGVRCICQIQLSSASWKAIKVCNKLCLSCTSCFSFRFIFKLITKHATTSGFPGQ